MSARLLAGGVSYGSPPDHSPSFWTVDRERRLSVLGMDGNGPIDRRVRTALALPIPGTARVLAVDVDRLRPLLASGGLWRLDTRAQRWRPLGHTVDMEDTMEKYASAWPSPGGGFIATDAERRLWAIGSTGEVAEFLPAPVPGAAPILAVDGSSKQVLLGDGTRFGYFGRGWVALGEPVASPTGGTGATMRLRAIGSFCLEAGKDVGPGDEFEVDEARARALIGRGKAEPVAEPA